jgi:hypothetical protein
MGPYAGVDYNLTLYGLQSRLQHMYYGQPYARIDLNPMPASTLHLPVKDLGFGLSSKNDIFLPGNSLLHLPP